MRIQRALPTPLLSLASLVLIVAVASGQMPGPMPGAGPMPGGGPMMAGYPMQVGYGAAPIPAYGAPGSPGYGADPGGVYADAAQAYYMAPPQGGPLPEVAQVGYQHSYDGCPTCNGHGCQYCRKGLLPKLGALMGGVGPYGLGPYADGGCCAPRWFDIHTEAMYLTRDDVGRRVDFTSLGIGGPIVLSTDDLEFEEELGFRITGAYQVGPGSNLELSYFGTFNWASAATVVSDQDILFSTFSDFGTAPFGGFLETDQAQQQSIEYSSAFDSLELDYRRRWGGADCRVQGSWLMGVRYLKLDEQFRYLSFVDRPDPDPLVLLPIRTSMDYFVGTSNDLTGFQLGGDLWVCLLPGLRVGGEMKAGIYGNQATQRTVFAATTIDPTIVEEVEEDEVAFIGEAGLMATYRLSYQLTLRAGYQFLFIDGIALAGENFNSAPPNVFSPPPPNAVRVPALNTNGNAFYHGFTAGFEYLW